MESDYSYSWYKFLLPILLLSTEGQNVNHTLASGDSMLRARASVLVDTGEVSERLLPGVGEGSISKVGSGCMSSEEVEDV